MSILDKQWEWKRGRVYAITCNENCKLRGDDLICMAYRRDEEEERLLTAAIAAVPQLIAGLEEALELLDYAAGFSVVADEATTEPRARLRRLLATLGR